MQTRKISEDKKGESLNGLKLQVTELTTLYEISQAIHASLDLEEIMNQVMDILHKKMGMERGTLTLLDVRTNELIIEVAHGLGKKEIERGRYRVGEGITGKVVAAGEPIVVPNVGNEPLFLNRTRSRGDIKRSNIAFICVPIKLDQKTIGALSVDRLFQENISFEEDVRLPWWGATKIWADKSSLSCATKKSSAGFSISPGNNALFDAVLILSTQELLFRVQFPRSVGGYKNVNETPFHCQCWPMRHGSSRTCLDKCRGSPSKISPTCIDFKTAFAPPR